MDRKSVLFLTYWYPHKSNKSLGIFVKRHAQAIAMENKIVVLCFIISKGSFFFKKATIVFFDENKIETHQINIDSIFNKLFYLLLPIHYLIIRLYVKKNFKNKTFDIVHSNVIFPCGIIGYWLSKKMRLNHVVTEHWTKIDKFFKVSAFRFVAKKALNSAHKLTFVSRQLLKTVQHYTSNQRTTIIPNVIDAKEFYFDTQITKNETLTFIAAAHWAQFKNPFYFLDALQTIHYQNLLPKFKIVLAGNGEQLQRVKANNYSFDIEFVGDLSPLALKNELNKSHIFLHGTDFETFSVIIAEALMCGLPCVVSPYGIALEAIHPDNGFVTNNTIKDWTDKIIQCYHSNYDNKLISETLKNKYAIEAVAKLFSYAYN
jgi:glycosyltransferase involved in cell wall biosynthesis